MPPHRLSLRMTPEGYVAAATFTPADGPPQTWEVRQDSQLRRVEGEPR